MTLLQQSIKYAKSNSLTKYFVTANIFNDIILYIIISDLMVRIAGGEKSWIPYLLGIQAIIPIIKKLIIIPLSTIIVNKISKQYIQDRYELYSKLSYESRVKLTFPSFKQAFSPSNWALCSMFSWGLPNLLGLTSSIVFVFWTFYQKQMLFHFIMLICSFGIFYSMYLRPKQIEFTKKDKKLRKQRHTVQAKIDLNGIPFQYRQVPLDTMVNHECVIADCGKDIEEFWDKIQTDTVLFIEYICIAITWFTMNDITNFLLISFALKQFSSAIQNLMIFMTQFNRLKNDYDTVNDMFKETVIEEEPEKLYLQDVQTITINQVDIPLSDTYGLKLDTSISDLKIQPGTHTLIMGPSGHGKSSFIKGLFGLFEKAKVALNIGMGKNFYHTVADYFQEIKEKMPSSKVTIRDYFKGNPDNEIIKMYLDKAWTEDEQIRIFQAMRNSNKSKKDVAIVVESKDVVIDIVSKDVVIDVDSKDIIHDYDLPINEVLSGGQKSRILLWLQAYHDKEIIVLDEPCPDVDHETYEDHVKRFFHENHNKSILMVAHPCECKKKFLFPLFKQLVKVEDGLIKRYI